MQSYDVWKLDCPPEDQEDLDYPDEYEDYDYTNPNADPLTPEERAEWEAEREFYAKYLVTIYGR